MPFLTLNNTYIQFARKKLTKRSYTTAEALPIIKWVEIIDRKEFTKAALDKNVEAFVVHVTSFSLNLMLIYPTQGAQIALLVIKKVQIPALDKNVEAFVVHVTSLSLNLMPIHPAQEVQIALWVIEKVQILSKYLDFLDVFSEERALILSEATNLNQHTIKLWEDQPCQRLYSVFKVTCWCSYPLC